jgi:Transglutaminase-like superfamily
MLLYVQALWQLVRFHYCVRGGNFKSLYEKVKNCRCARKAWAPAVTERICAAIDVACIWYPKHVLCLQRSAATTCLLRSYGVPAQLLLGAQKLPFKAHAWVEVHGLVVNDKPYAREMYALLDSC